MRDFPDAPVSLRKRPVNLLLEVLFRCAFFPVKVEAKPTQSKQFPPNKLTQKVEVDKKSANQISMLSKKKDFIAIK